MQVTLIFPCWFFNVPLYVPNAIGGAISEQDASIVALMFTVPVAVRAMAGFKVLAPTLKRTAKNIKSCLLKMLEVPFLIV